MWTVQPVLGSLVDQVDENKNVITLFDVDSPNVYSLEKSFSNYGTPIFFVSFTKTTLFTVLKVETSKRFTLNFLLLDVLILSLISFSPFTLRL